MTGRASPAKAAVGDKPVFAYIASLPQPQRDIAEAVDTLAAKTLPELRRSVKWGMSYYGVGDGWCFSCGGFAGHVKLMFINGATLEPIPPVTPVGMGKSTRGVELESVDDLDEIQIAAWMKHRVRTRCRWQETLNPLSRDERSHPRHQGWPSCGARSGGAATASSRLTVIERDL
jgi:hypothetical protein